MTYYVEKVYENSDILVQILFISTFQLLQLQTRKRKPKNSIKAERSLNKSIGHALHAANANSSVKIENLCKI